MRLRNISTVTGVRCQGVTYGEGQEFTATAAEAWLIAAGICIRLDTPAPAPAAPSPAPSLPPPSPPAPAPSPSSPKSHPSPTSHSPGRVGRRHGA